MDENSKLPGSSSGIQGGAKEKRVMKRCQFSMILLDCTDGNPTLLRQASLAFALVFVIVWVGSGCHTFCIPASLAAFTFKNHHGVLVLARLLVRYPH